MGRLPEMLPAAEGPGHLLRWGAVAATLVFGFLAGLALLLESAGPEVAHQVLDPLAASLSLAGLMLGSGARLAASLLDTLSSALVTTDLTVKLAFCALFVGIYALLLAALARLRPTSGAARLPGR
jgi:hypothetical protein